MKNVYSFIRSFVGGLLLFVLPAIAWAATGVPVDPEIPAWVYKVLGVAAGLIGIVSQVDAQISEEFKRRWPWWIRLFWNIAAGNYRHSKNMPTPK
ncbi:hypothetical protein [Vibrio sp. TBV020]|uniref:hypothetical protein n=1 Tax=Vibrio sp. TBV020 TaxID=3137398 RepID=UPI0038CD2917